MRTTDQSPNIMNNSKTKTITQTTITSMYKRTPTKNDISYNKSTKSNDTLRIITNNINTLATHDIIKMQAMFHTLRTYKCYIALLTETKTNSRNKNVWQQIQENANCMWASPRVQLASVPDSHIRDNYQP